ncbi:hypothetical protein Fcan01_16344 [Folsomia candida]|uniref:Uncharacterized protein n=1 Tax=Folsomia candida TaxID=158441 RepID=A0A226DT97_FOLCA|nr:hypothetical protein Fcan01_16344 [Folsomia candida]
MTCFLCASPSTSDVPHNGHVTRQISLFKDLLNKEAFAKGFLAHSTYSLEYPTAENESDKSCATCLTRVGQVWELHREILELQGEMKTMLGRTLFEHDSAKKPAPSEPINIKTETNPESTSTKAHPGRFLPADPIQHKDTIIKKEPKDTIVPVKVEGDDAFFEFEDAEEMPIASSTSSSNPHFSNPVVSTAKSIRSYSSKQRGRDCQFGCTRCEGLFPTKAFLMKHISKCTGVKFSR